MSDSSIQFEILSISPSHIIDDSIVKDQPGNTLVNKYLSTAAQYLSRTKSFHVSPTTDNNNNHCRSNVDHSPRVLLKHQLDFDRSIPGHLHDNQSSMSNEIPADCNKSQGFVNTLRRSLRKSKERFYNKRSATMKSCHSLHNYDQTSMNNQTNNSTPMAMTPTLPIRQPYSTNSCSNTPKNRSMRKKN